MLDQNDLVSAYSKSEKGCTGHSEDACLEYNVIFHSWSSVGSLWQVLSDLKKIPNRKDLAESTESSQRPSKHKLQEREGMLSRFFSAEKAEEDYICNIHMHLKEERSK